MDEQDWAAYRKRLRTRTARQMALIIFPLVALMSVIKILEPMDYPVGDLRNSLEFRLLFYGLFVAFAVAVLIDSVRWLLTDRRS
jgi:hypothetical protein